MPRTAEGKTLTIYSVRDNLGREYHWTTSRRKAEERARDRERLLTLPESRPLAVYHCRPVKPRKVKP